MTLRKQVNQFLADDAKMSVNDFIVKAAALTLRQFPNLNASFAGDKVVRHGAVNIGVAVAGVDGLVGPAQLVTKYLFFAVHFPFFIQLAGGLARERK